MQCHEEGVDEVQAMARITAEKNAVGTRVAIPRQTAARNVQEDSRRGSGYPAQTTTFVPNIMSTEDTAGENEKEHKRNKG